VVSVDHPGVAARGAGVREMAVRLTVPIDEKSVRALHIGDSVLLSGVVFTGRDAAHKYMKETFVAGPCPASERDVYEALKKGLAGGVI